MINSTEISSVMELLIGIESGLFAIIITLVAVVPAFIEIARSSSPGFLSERRARLKMRKSLRILKHLLWVVALSITAAFIGIFCPTINMLIINLILLGINFIPLVVISFIISSEISATM